mgnify:CR=1 FL=1
MGDANQFALTVSIACRFLSTRSTATAATIVTTVLVDASRDTLILALALGITALSIVTASAATTTTIITTDFTIALGVTDGFACTDIVTHLTLLATTATSTATIVTTGFVDAVRNTNGRTRQWECPRGVGAVLIAIVVLGLVVPTTAVAIECLQLSFVTVVEFVAITTSLVRQAPTRIDGHRALAAVADLFTLARATRATATISTAFLAVAGRHTGFTLTRRVTGIGAVACTAASTASIISADLALTVGLTGITTDWIVARRIFTIAPTVVEAVTSVPSTTIVAVTALDGVAFAIFERVALATSFVRDVTTAGRWRIIRTCRTIAAVVAVAKPLRTPTDRFGDAIRFALSIVAIRRCVARIARTTSISNPGTWR